MAPARETAPGRGRYHFPGRIPNFREIFERDSEGPTENAPEPEIGQPPPVRNGAIPETPPR